MVAVDIAGVDTRFASLTTFVYPGLKRMANFTIDPYDLGFWPPNQLPGNFTVGTLPAIPNLPKGVSAYTTDGGIVIWNGQGWSIPLRKRPFMPAGMGNVQQVIPAMLFMGTANQTAASSTVTITAVTQGSIYVGSVLSGPSVPVGTTVTAILTGNGGVGTVTVNNTTGFVSTPITAIGSAAPVVAISTTNPLAAGLQFSPYFNSLNGTAGTVDLSFCSISRGGNPVPAGTAFPDYNFVTFNTVSTTLNGTNYSGGNSVQVSVMHSGLTIVMVVKGLATNITAKVNDQYVSLTPTAVPTNATLNFYSLTFSTVQERRIDFIGDNVLGAFKFGGFWVGATDTLYPAQIRGPRIMMVGDSIVSSTGAGSSALGLPGAFAEYMGWDDVWQSGIGGTGLINPGSYCTYGQRAATDIYPFAPDEVIISGFYNDSAFTAAAIQVALINLIQGILTNLPTTRVTVFAPYVNTGSGFHGGNPGFAGTRTACTAAVASFNSPQVKYIDPTTGPAPTTPQVATLTNSPGAGATTFTTSTFLTPGTTYQFPDGTRSFMISRSGFTATVDRVFSPQTSGTQITQVGNCYLRGSGFVGAPTGSGNADLLVFTDDVHPSSAGHLALGIMLGEAYAANLNS